VSQTAPYHHQGLFDLLSLSLCIWHYCSATDSPGHSPTNRRLIAILKEFPISCNDQNQQLKNAQCKYDSIHRRWRNIKDWENAEREAGPSEIIERLKGELQSVHARHNKTMLDTADIQKQTSESQH
jgi:hypothetical protein